MSDTPGLQNEVSEKARAELDVNERHGMEFARAYLAAIIESSDDAIVSKALDGTITSWNKGAERMFGYSAEEAVGKSILLIIPPELTPDEDEILKKLCKGEKIDHFETERVRKDGSRIQISVTISPIRNASGEIVGASKIARDITERKRAEEAIKEADRLKDEFLATLSHELRNPLAPIRNAVQALKQLGPPDPQLQQLRGIIDRQVAQMTRLVDDLLDISRITQNRITLHKERLELMTVVGRAVETSRPLIDDRKHHLAVSLPAEPAAVEGDLTRLAQVISNLLNNAAKYTEEGGNIWLTAEKSGAEVILKVKDDGIGIQPHILPRIFDLFTQADGSLDRSQGGLGLGLALVRRLVELHGGRVEARSEGQGKGSEFAVHLPAATEVESKGEIAETAASVSSAKRCRILVVDDNADAAESLAMILRLKGHEVRVAYDGLVAIESARDFRPEVVLLDIGLPVMDGYEVARQLRRLDEAKAAFLIAMTGYGRAEDRIKALSAGFNYHITKPADLQELDAVINTLAPDC
ncbi:MAG TPA: PAS domain S-box protein, partial [Blastocatellia bacterium]|nr:PAS domain S-box protein [Blastocatellia bacterium]